MLSSFICLTALRQGDFLTFLRWPSVVYAKYNPNANNATKGEMPGADQLIDCLIFEWIKYSFSEKDIEQMALLKAVLDKDDELLMDQKRHYYWVMLTSALISCMAYQSYQVNDQITSSTASSSEEIHALFANITIKAADLSEVVLKDSELRDTINTMQEDFNARLAKINRTLVHAAYKKINLIINPLNQLNQYRDLLLEQEKQFEVRLETVHSFCTYLEQQNELTIEVSTKIESYIKELRDQELESWEEEYLQQILPPSLEEKIVSSFISYGITWFKAFAPVEMPNTSSLSDTLNQ